VKKMGNKQRFEKEKRVEIGRIDGDVEISDCDFIVPLKGSEIVVDGVLSIKGRPPIIDGSLKCEHLDIDCRDEVEIRGDLTVEASVKVSRGRLKIDGSAKARRFNISSALEVGKDLECTTVSCGGALRVGGDVKAEKLSVGGAARINGKIEVEDLSAGGAATCSHGIVGRVNVGGAFKASGAMEIGDLDVGGAAVVGPGSKILDIDVGGAFKCRGDLVFEQLDVGGSAKIDGDASGKEVDIGGVLKVTGSLTLTEDLNVGGVVVVGKDLHVNGNIEVGGKLEAGGRIEGIRINVGGGIRATYIKAQDFRIGRRGEVRGFVEATDIIVSEKVRGESFYGEKIRVEERARVRNLYGRDIYLERDVTVEGEIHYTGTLETERGVELRNEPQKVKKLPAPEKVSK
jgi:cytoskeletal protein CcmA (bactofilin family)